jgi:hypothetical protein
MNAFTPQVVAEMRTSIQQRYSLAENFPLIPPAVVISYDFKWLHKGDIGMKESRRRQTVQELERLNSELGAWKERRINADTSALGNYRGRYDSQLNHIEREIGEAARVVGGLLGGDLSGKTYGAVCREFNFHDQRIIWIRYVWDYFREKLDQRDDISLKPALEAADEVLWSCYHPYFQHRKLSAPPPPIAGICYDYTASALKTQSGYVLERRVDTLGGPMKEYFQKLPVGILRLPPTVVTAPWTLGLIAHECGHFLQDAVEAGAPSGGSFADKVEAAVRGAGGTEEDVKAWRRWSIEIFADWTAVLALGPWSIWVLAPWVLTEQSGMLSRQAAYPSPLVRLLLIGQIAKELDGTEQQLGDLCVSEQAAVTAESQLDWRIARAVAGLVEQPLGNSAENLSDHFDFRKSDYAPGGGVEQWAESLLDRKPKSPSNDLRAARLVAAGALKAHHELATTLDEKALESALEALKERTAKTLAKCHEEGKRAVAPLFREAPIGGLAQALMQASKEDLLI